MVTKPPKTGGLGFTFKWNMGFMHDTLGYMSMDHYFRQFEHNKLTFSLHYAFNENHILAYSHDEVVHGKLSMIGKMFGDYWQKFASLRALYGFMYAHPGKKLMFMGDEFAQFIEWDFAKQLDWFLLDYDSHRGMQTFVKRLNDVYKKQPALFEIDDGWDGFTWLNVDDSIISAYAFMRNGPNNHIVCVVNFTPLVRENYMVALPCAGTLKLVLNSDSKAFGGSGAGAHRAIAAERVSVNGMPCGASVQMPPLSVLYYEFIPDGEED
jgi:1,4-alpha-glucan branching enzyme